MEITDLLADLFEENSEELLETAGENPDDRAVVSRVVGYLESGEESQRVQAATALNRISDGYEQPHLLPDGESPVVPEYVPTLVAGLDDESDDVRRNVAQTVVSVAAGYPAQVADHVEAMAGRIDDETVGVEMLTGLGHVANGGHAQRVVGYHPEIVEQFDGDVDVQVGAMYVLGVIAERFPETATEYTTEVVTVFETENDQLRTNAASILANIAAHDTGAVVETIPDIVGEIQRSYADERPSVEEMQVKENFCDVVATVASDQPDVTAAHLPEIAKSLDDQVPAVQQSTAEILAVHEGYPDELAAVLPSILDYLTQETQLVTHPDDPLAEAAGNLVDILQSLVDEGTGYLVDYAADLEEAHDALSPSQFAGRIGYVLNRIAESHPDAVEPLAWEPLE